MPFCAVCACASVQNEVLEAVGESWEEQDAAESRWMTEQELDMCLAK
jgi:hypothetical protein